MNIEGSGIPRSASNWHLIVRCDAGEFFTHTRQYAFFGAGFIVGAFYLPFSFVAARVGYFTGSYWPSMGSLKFALGIEMVLLLVVMLLPRKVVSRNGLAPKLRDPSKVLAVLNLSIAGMYLVCGWMIAIALLMLIGSQLGVAV